MLQQLYDNFSLPYFKANILALAILFLLSLFILELFVSGGIGNNYLMLLSVGWPSLILICTVYATISFQLWHVKKKLLFLKLLGCCVVIFFANSCIINFVAYINSGANNFYNYNWMRSIGFIFIISSVMILPFVIMHYCFFFCIDKFLKTPS